MNPLAMAMESKKKSKMMPMGPEQLLEKILAQLTVMTDYLRQDVKEDQPEKVVTQESHTP